MLSNATLEKEVKMKNERRYVRGESVKEETTMLRKRKSEKNVELNFEWKKRTAKLVKS